MDSDSESLSRSAPCSQQYKSEPVFKDPSSKWTNAHMNNFSYGWFKLAEGLTILRDLNPLGSTHHLMRHSHLFGRGSNLKV